MQQQQHRRARRSPRPPSLAPSPPPSPSPSPLSWKDVAIRMAAAPPPLNLHGSRGIAKKSVTNAAPSSPSPGGIHPHGNLSKAWADPKDAPRDEEAETRSEDQADSSVTAEAIAVESLLALDVLAHCAVIQSQIHDSAASSSSCPPPSPSPPALQGRRVFVQCLGFSIFQRRRWQAAPCPRPGDGGDVSTPPWIGQGIGRRPKRKRAALLPSKFHDSVLLLKNSKNSSKNSKNSTTNTSTGPDKNKAKNKAKKKIKR